jgi:hypothetical protein
MGFYIPEDGIFHSHSRENLKCYGAYFFYIGSLEINNFSPYY